MCSVSVVARASIQCRPFSIQFRLCLRRWLCLRRLRLRLRRRPRLRLRLRVRHLPPTLADAYEHTSVVPARDFCAHRYEFAAWLSPAM